MKTWKRIRGATALLAIGMVFTASLASAAEVRIAIMQDSAGDARKYQPLLDYLGTKGIEASFATAQNYPAAAKMFGQGKVDAMFSGSGIAGSFIIKGLADPIARPQPVSGLSTYSAVVIAPKGSPAFDGSPVYFSGKRVIYSPLASSGEFYFRSLGTPQAAKMLKAASHGAALDGLARKQADVAVVKNHVWNKVKGNFPGLEMVGGDDGQNPDGTLIVAKKLPSATAEQLREVLVALGTDNSAQAKAVKDALGCTGFIATTGADFEHTLSLLGKAGVTADFNFEF